MGVVAFVYVLSGREGDLVYNVFSFKDCYGSLEG